MPNGSEKLNIDPRIYDLIAKCDSHNSLLASLKAGGHYMSDFFQTHDSGGELAQKYLKFDDDLLVAMNKQQLTSEQVMALVESIDQLKLNPDKFSAEDIDQLTEIEQKVENIFIELTKKGYTESDIGVVRGVK